VSAALSAAAAGPVAELAEAGVAMGVTVATGGGGWVAGTASVLPERFALWGSA
jgi:hypothetical protein